MIEISDLRAFAGIAELRSVSGSARSLGVLKSTVSRSLVRPEEVLGLTLVERSMRNLHLTDAGAIRRSASSWRRRARDRTRLPSRPTP